jgi:hypothetical protein
MSLVENERVFSRIQIFHITGFIIMTFFPSSSLFSVIFPSFVLWRNDLGYENGYVVLVAGLEEG